MGSETEEGGTRPQAQSRQSILFLSASWLRCLTRKHLLQTNSVAWIGTTRVSTGSRRSSFVEGDGDLLLLLGLLLLGARLLLDQQVLDRLDLRDRGIGGVDGLGRLRGHDRLVEVGLRGLEVLELLLLGRSSSSTGSSVSFSSWCPSCSSTSGA